MKKFAIYVVLFNLSLSVFSSYAQAEAFRKNAATIMFGGVIGAGAGLGSLIFYSNPQSHTENITTGLLLGLIGGTIYVATHKETSQVNDALLIDSQNAVKVSYAAFNKLDLRNDLNKKGSNQEAFFPVTQVEFQF